MSDRSSDLHIEVRAGVGEPPSMAAPRGGELGPLSIGHAGAWRVVAMGVRDEHAFVYFDGNMLHMQSISGGAPAIVNGQPLPLEWTPVPEGSEIRLGEAVLWFGPGDAQGEVRRPSERPFAPGAFINEDSVVPGMVVRAIPAPPPPSARVPPPPPPPNAAPPADPAFFPPAPPPPTIDPEVTRLAPIEEITGKAAKHPRPAAGAPMTAPTGTIQMAAVTPFGGVPAAMPAAMPMTTPMGGVPAAAPSNPPAPVPYIPPSNPPMALGSAYGPPAQLGGPAMGPPSSMAPIAPPKPDPLAQLKAYWKDAPPPRKAILVLSPFVLVSVFVLFFYEPAPPPAPPRPPTNTTAPSARPSATPSGDPSPPPTETGPIVATPPPVTAPPVEPSGTPTGKPAPSGSASAPKKTLQRAAADAVAAGAFLEAAALYEQLAREHPENPAYAEAARIMRAKAAGKR